MIKICAVSMLLVLACSGPALAEVKVEETSSTYDLKGLTPKELHANIIEAAPNENGKVVDAETKERLTFTLQYTTKDGSCRIASDQVKLEIISTFPRWVDEERAFETARKVWTAYLTALRNHEDGHRAIALKSANTIDNLIHNEKGFAPTCEVLKDRIEEAADTTQSAAESEQEGFEANAPKFDIAED